MRTFGKYLLAIVGALLASAAISTTSAWLLVGTPGHVASTVERVLASDEGARGIGAMFVSQVSDSADGEGKALLASRSDELAAAAADGLRGAGPELEAVVTTAFDAISQGTTATVDIAPVAGKALVAMHAVEPQVPTDTGGDMRIDINGADTGPVAGILSGIGLWWVLAVLAIAALAGAGLCDRRAPMRRFRVSGIALAVPAVLWLLASIGGGSAASGQEMDDPAAADLVHGLIATAQSTIGLVAGVALGIAVVVIVLSAVIGRTAADRPAEAPTIAA